MSPLSPSEAARRFEAQNLGVTQAVTGFATDSRSVKPGDLFLAIRGQNVDGHEFAETALKAGAAAVLCEEKIGGPCFLVPNLVASLANFGRSYRSEFAGPVVGITGSAGKTTTKELTAAALSALGPVLKSEGNRNTEYTSPLTWAEIPNGCQSAVIEMGMRGFDQISHLASISMPTIGIITMIGTAHIEKVGSRAGIAQAKGELLGYIPESGSAILWDSDDFLEVLTQKCEGSVYTFGFTPEADSRIIGYRGLDWSRSLVRGSIDGEEWEVELPGLGRHQARNASAAILAAVLAGASVSDAAEAMSKVSLPPMRMEVVKHQGSTLILDFYNASPDSTVTALQALSEVPTEGRRLAVLGEMKELGDFTEAGHRLVGKALAESSVDLAFLTGGPTKLMAEEAIQAGFPASKLISDEELDIERVTEFLAEIREGDVVLIKGSRALGLERAIPRGVMGA